MKFPVKILMLEDSGTDAEMIRRLLLKEKWDCNFLLASDKETYVKMLDEHDPDIILSDNSLPQFNATEALKIAQQKKQETPFIVVTGTMSEEFAASIIKSGADDYILKDRMARLPAAIEAAIRQHRSEKEKKAALQKLLESENQYRTFVERISDGFLSLDMDMKITYINIVAEQMLKRAHGFLLGKNFINEFPDAITIPLMEVVSTAINQRRDIHKEYFSEYLHIWIFVSVYPSDTGLSIYFRDITERKKLENDLKEQQRKEELKLIASTLEAQEKERNLIGLELHDNVNQILVGTCMFLSTLKKRPDRINEIIPSSIDKIKEAIEENRKISHELVTPDIAKTSLIEQITKLTESIKHSTEMVITIDHNELQENLLNNHQMLAIYRIAQEQFTNIAKYANASTVEITLSTNGRKKLLMKIADDGLGMASGKKNTGIGLRNIASRLSVLDGKMNIETKPGKGFVLEIEFPIK